MKGKFKDNRAVKLEKVLAGDFIPFCGGRPQRTLIISKDDSLDLTIMLHTTSSVEEFLSKL